MRGRPGFFDVDERLEPLSETGDAMERLSSIVDFERFRRHLARAAPRSDEAKGGRSALDRVFMFKVMVLHARHSLSGERMEFTIWVFREAHTRAQIEGKPAEGGSKRVDIAVPGFRSRHYVGIDRRHRLIRTWIATDAARHDTTRCNCPG